MWWLVCMVPALTGGDLSGAISDCVRKYVHVERQKPAPFERVSVGRDADKAQSPFSAHELVKFLPGERVDEREMDGHLLSWPHYSALECGGRGGMHSESDTLAKFIEAGCSSQGWPHAISGSLPPIFQDERKIGATADFNVADGEVTRREIGAELSLRRTIRDLISLARSFQRTAALQYGYEQSDQPGRSQWYLEYGDDEKPSGPFSHLPLGAKIVFAALLFAGGLYGLFYALIGAALGRFGLEAMLYASISIIWVGGGLAMGISLIISG